MADRSPQADLDWDSGIVLELPLPISANEKKNIAYASRRQYTRVKNTYKKRVWQQAVMQHEPSATPPAFCHVHALLRVHNLRDEDKLGDSLEWVIDALRQLQPGKKPPLFRFTKHGLPIFTGRGYFVDDSPRHIDLAVDQVIDRKNKGLTLRIVGG